ncbi:hypothetical protein BH09BAC5_BH09BAC5_23960 [soil metagenome]
MKGLLTLLIICIFSFAACKKDEPVIVQAQSVRALILVQHHGIPIPNASVFMKNGTLVFPGQDTTLYDSRYVSDANGRVTIYNISNGQGAYTFYAKGVDPGWDSTHVTPVWGYQFLITDTHTGETKDYNVSLPVSE